ncbi:MAG: hypothetical protein ATN31_00310 [Candidatus Epulonipiscioides saccharophilum]|nr:MAG: hypothetical protein ATN31_00310 [Epulopiscium sp. AS2M-Bin001]
MENITYRPITKKLIKSESGIKDVYCTSFPGKERLPLWFLVSKSRRKDIEFLAFYDEDKFVGLTYLIRNNTKVYILYIAMDSSLRSKGYGTRVLNIIKSRYNDKTIFLSMEEVSEKYNDFAIRKSRLEFYIKNGFVKNNYVVKEIGQHFETMSFNGLTTKEDLIDTVSILAKPAPKFILKWVLKKYVQTENS